MFISALVIEKISPFVLRRDHHLIKSERIEKFSMPASGGEREGFPPLSLNTDKKQNTQIPSNLLESNMYATLAKTNFDSTSVTSSLSKKRKVKHLDIDDDNESFKSSSRPTKPPPIFIKGNSRAQVDKILSTLQAERSNFLSKLIPGGVKVFASDTANHILLREHLKACQVKFQTHALREEQMTKVVLHGLHSMELSVLKDELSRLEIFPAEIKTLAIRKKLNDDHCVYLLYFSKSSKIKLSELRETAAICYTRVRWEYYRNRRKGPIQCNNCMQYGHGGKYCFLDPLCIRCGESHKSASCPMITTIDPVTLKLQHVNRIPDEQLKCGLCGQNHTANSIKCEKRNEFIQRQQKYRSKTQRRPQDRRAQNFTRQTFMNAPQLTDFNFPQLNQPTTNERAWNNPKFPPSHQQSQQASHNLFNQNELLSIFRELMQSLSNAKSQQEQIWALGEIVIKYCNVSR